MIFRIILMSALLVGGRQIVSLIRRLKDEYSYNYEDVDDYVDRH